MTHFFHPRHSKKSLQVHRGVLNDGREAEIAETSVPKCEEAMNLSTHRLTG